jgi:endosialidase-like protein
MKKMILKTLTRFNMNLRNSANPAPLLRASLLIPLLACCFPLLAKAQDIPGVRERTPAAPQVALAGLNTADGTKALGSVTTGIANSAFGWFSLSSNTDGSFNTGVGAGTLLFNIGDQTTGEGLENTAVGAAALLLNTTGFQNTAVGATALENNDSGIRNTGIGSRALINVVDGDENTAVGRRALEGVVSGNTNVALGWQAGFQATGSNNVYIGANMQGVAGEDKACYIGSIFGETVDPGTAALALIDANGKLGTVVSARRFKQDIEPMDKASEAILFLKPVTFHFKSDKKGTPQYGLIAEEVAQVDPNLVVRDKEGAIISVHYDQVWNMMLNEFLKEHKAFVEQQQKVEQLEATIAGLVATMKDQAAQIQKVSAQLEVSKPAAQVVSYEQ